MKQIYFEMVNFEQDIFRAAVFKVTTRGSSIICIKRETVTCLSRENSC